MHNFDPLRVLLVAREAEAARPIFRQLEQGGIRDLTVIDWTVGAAPLLHASAPEHDACVVIGLECGLEVLEAVRTYGDPLPVVVLDPRSPSVLKEVLEAGAAGYLSPDEMTPRVLERSVRHVLERFRFEEALRAREAQYRLALKASGLGTWEYDATTGERWWDARTQEIFGVQVEGPAPPELWDALCHPAELPREKAAFDALVEGRLAGEYTTEVRIIRPNGELRWIRGHGLAEFTGVGEFRRCKRVIGTIEDITAARRVQATERVLARSGEAFGASLEVRETLANIARLGAEAVADICVVDIIGESGDLERIEIAVSDPAHQQMADWLRENPLFDNPGSSTSRAFSSGEPVIIPDVSIDDIRALELPPEVGGSLESHPPRSVMSTPIRRLDRTLGTLLFVSMEDNYDDIDLTMATELARRAALSIDNALLYDAARRALASRDELQHIIAHDLRDPLNAISLNVGLVARLVQDDSRDLLHRALSGQQQAIANMKTLIDDLLWAARLDSGNLVIKPAPLAIREVVDEVIALYHAAARQKGVILVARSPVESPIALADRTRMGQVLGNLVGNALQFTPPGGNIEIRVDHVVDAVRVSVSDTGPGMTSELAARVFERFWQADGSRSGVGLGLWIARSLVELQGGTIGVRSVAGEGTEFHLTLPLADQRSMATQPV